ncbi:hypothetical protein PoB_007548900 [Plakobranchus ocellatus]|uniref:Uncharacterized protein n=1 Tax=Plakobranchus ocellatus TaxID=259542 RepID=A0AAV4DXP9_9GAST|nr:hypothetical protein PoB_007548900 [Plakobranchus ocellatus]
MGRAAKPSKNLNLSEAAKQDQEPLEDVQVHKGGRLHKPERQGGEKLLNLFSGPPAGQGASCGARTRGRKVLADLGVDSLSIVPPTPVKVRDQYQLPRRILTGDLRLSGHLQTRASMTDRLKLTFPRGGRSHGGFAYDFATKAILQS